MERSKFLGPFFTTKAMEGKIGERRERQKREDSSQRERKKEEREERGGEERKTNIEG